MPLINDRVDVALAIEAEGVHLGKSDMPYPEARRLLGWKKIIGLTVETLEQLERINQWDVQYIGIGPIFPTQTKLDAPTLLSIAGLATFCKLSRHPVIAIGGIHISNAEAVLNAGAQGFAGSQRLAMPRSQSK